MKNILVLIASLTISTFISARESLPVFTPTHITVADGFLQIRMPSAYSVEGCAETNTVVLPDDHKYFDSFLSLAMTAFTLGKKLGVSVGAPCQGSLNWPLISVMKLQN